MDELETVSLELKAQAKALRMMIVAMQLWNRFDGVATEMEVEKLLNEAETQLVKS